MHLCISHPATSQTLRAEKLAKLRVQCNQVLGKVLIDVRMPNGSTLNIGNDDELEFDDGAELTVFVHDDGTLHVEGD